MFQASKRVTAHSDDARAVVVAMEDPGELGAAVGALAAVGIEAVPARDGVEALLIVERRASHIGLVVADLLLPTMSGRRICRALSWAGQSVPILLIGGYSPREVRERAALDPATPFLPRPWSVPDFIARVSELLRPERQATDPAGGRVRPMPSGGPHPLSIPRFPVIP